MLHGEYEKLRQTLQVGLRAVGLDRFVEVEGPNRLGGFRLGDGNHCVALSLVPPRRREDREAGRCWWVSAWMPITDGYDALITPDLLPIPHRREVMLKKPLAYEEAVIAAVQLFAELRTRSAFQEATKGTDIERGSPLLSAGATVSTSPNRFRTAPNRAERDTVEPKRL